MGVGYGHQELTERVVHWELNGNKVHLRDNDYSVVADPKTPIAEAVIAANNSTIIITFPVAAFAKDGAPVIQVTRLFSTDVPEISARQRLGATTLDASRCFIERISAYPENIEAEATMTYTRSPTPAGTNAPAPAPTGGLGGGQMRPGSATLVLHHSMVKLPEKPMMPRVFDERVGYFTTNLMDYSKDEHRAPRVRYIDRWRLEKKDPGAAVSEPVKPLVYYIDSATPVKWREWLKKGVESWQPAFEAAGFKNAIIAKVAPTPEEDTDFSIEDVRNSVIRWLPSTIENAVGPNIHDPRTGEILNAPIQFYHNIMNLQRSWYFLQVGPLDARAQKLPLPDDLMGRLLEFVVAHEVGHTLGFQHNMKASSTYPQEKVRDKDWMHKMGAAPSIMDYARFDYVAQPEDHVAVEDLVPRVGPYDIWATKWGYTPIAGAKTPEEEKPTLDKWAREQDTTPWYRFSTYNSAGSDPGELTEAIGDADAIKSTALGVKNLQRVAKMLMPATTAKQGEPYDDLAELYGRMLGQWTLEMGHVAAIVGGFDTREKYVGQEGLLFTPVPKARQEAAVKFLNENAFATPTWAIDPQILRRIEPTGVLGRIRNAQSSVLNNLLSSARFARLVEQEAIDGSAAYAPADFLATVRKGVWKELDAPQVKVDAYRRNLQHAYLDLVNSKINGAAPSIPAGMPAEIVVLLSGATSADEKSLYRAELRSLTASVSSALAKATDRESRAHLEGVRDQIARILDPRFAPPAGSAGGVTIRIGIGELDLFSASPDQIETCWPDYIIRP
ncbi:MAG: zinc-dependent metalloprotease [Bryobacteraceae bacterium]